MKKVFTLIVIAAVVITISCSKKMASQTTTEPAKPAVAYTANVGPLILSKCTPCHIPANGGFKKALDTYDAAKNNIDDIIYRVKLTPGTPKYMPFKHAPLSADEVAVFTNWKDGGFK